MPSKGVCRLAVSIAILVSIGCTANEGIIRGQSPSTSYAPQQNVMQAGAMQYAQPTQAMPVYFEGSPSASPYMMPGSPYCPTGNCQFGNGSYGNCPPGAPCGNGKRTLFGPQHHHAYDYSTPENLVYPPANQQPAMVQYPYYTVRGPTDFFMK